MSKDYKGEFFDAADFNPSEWHEYYVYRVEGGYRVWTFQPSPWEVEGLEEVDCLER